MQITIYFADDDEYLITRAQEESKIHRTSVSALLLTALEYYFEGERRVGEILVDQGILEQADLEKALEVQGNDKGKPLGEILLSLDLIKPTDLRRALVIQRKGDANGA
jgi:hypothetical protein